MAQAKATMRATVIENIGKPRALKSMRLARPQLSTGEALVKIHATSVNTSDLLFRSGKLVLRKPLPHVLGSDLAGAIEAVADDVTGWKVGDHVAATFERLGSERDGSYAEYCAVPASELVKLPDDLDFETAAAAGGAFANAWLALVQTGKLKKTDRVVIHSAASFIGTAAVQIAAARGAQVIAVSEGQYAANLRAIGAVIVLEDAGDDLVRQVQLATDEQGATLVLHSADTGKLAQSIEMLDSGGRLVIACAQPDRSFRLNLMDIYLKSLSVLGAYGSIKAKESGVAIAGGCEGALPAGDRRGHPAQPGAPSPRQDGEKPAFWAHHPGSRFNPGSGKETRKLDPH